MYLYKGNVESLEVIEIFYPFFNFQKYVPVHFYSLAKK